MNIDALKKIAVTPEQQLALDNAILLVRSGSHLYGTSTPQSDRDYVGVFVAPKEYQLGRKKIEIVELRSNKSSSGVKNTKDDFDCTFYELNKWFSLLEGNSPSHLELLFVNEQNRIFWTEIADLIFSKRSIFISKRLRHAFAGYAYSQLKRNEIKSGNQTGRKELIEKYGFDSKLLSHAVRLYTEALDLLLSGELHFPLYNNLELLDIKSGAVDYDTFQEKCKKLEDRLELAYITSNLQYSPDYEAIHNLQVEIYMKHNKLTEDK